MFNFKGVDYINKHGVKIEFKESHKQDCPLNKIRFAVYKKDRDDSDIIVFSHIHNENNMLYCYVHNSDKILKKYKFASVKQIAQPYLITVQKNYLAKFCTKYKTIRDIINKFEELKKYLDVIKYE